MAKRITFAQAEAQAKRAAKQRARLLGVLDKQDKNLSGQERVQGKPAKRPREDLNQAAARILREATDTTRK
jgi:hypothetical protein